MHFEVCCTEAWTSVPKRIYLLMYSGHLAFYPLTPTLYCCQNIFLWRVIFTFSFFRVNVDAPCCVTKTEWNTKVLCCWVKCQEFIVLNGMHYLPGEQTLKSDRI